MKKILLIVACSCSVGAQSNLIAMENFAEELRECTAQIFKLNLSNSDSSSLGKSFRDFIIASEVISNLSNISTKIRKKYSESISEERELYEEIRKEAGEKNLQTDESFYSFSEEEYFFDFLKKYLDEPTIEGIKVSDKESLKKCMNGLDCYFENNENSETWRLLKQKILETGILSIKASINDRYIGFYDLLSDELFEKYEQICSLIKKENFKNLNILNMLKICPKEELIEFIGAYYSSLSPCLSDVSRQLRAKINVLEQKNINVYPELRSKYEKWKSVSLLSRRLNYYAFALNETRERYNDFDQAKKNIDRYILDELYRGSRPLTKQEQARISTLQNSWNVSGKEFRMITPETWINIFELSSKVKNHYVNLLKHGSLSDVYGEIDCIIDSGKIKFDESSFFIAVEKLRDTQPSLYKYLNSLETKTTSSFAELTRRMFKKAAEVPAHRDMLIVFGAWLNTSAPSAGDMQEYFYRYKYPENIEFLKEKSVVLFCGDDTNDETCSAHVGRTIRVDFFNKIFGYNLSPDFSLQPIDYLIQPIDILFHEIGHMVFSNMIISSTLQGDTFSWELIGKMYSVKKDSAIIQKNNDILQNLGKNELNGLIEDLLGRKYNFSEESAARDFIKSLQSSDRELTKLIHWQSLLELWQIFGVFHYKRISYINPISDFAVSLQKKEPVRISHLGGVIPVNGSIQQKVAKTSPKLEMQNPITNYTLRTDYWMKWINFFGISKKRYQENIDSNSIWTQMWIIPVKSLSSALKYEYGLAVTNVK